MDNKTLHEVENFIHLQQTHLQYTPPDIHHTNPAEHTICTWKNHFLAGMAGLPKSFSIANWCQLTTQWDATLNMLRPCCQNPLLLAHEALEGSFSFNATPMAPLGTEVLVHTKPNRRSTWGYHTSKAWYLSHSLNHYRCIRVLMADTGGKRITDTFGFCHHAIAVPTITATDQILHATERFTVAIAGIQEALPDKSKPYAHSSLAKCPRLSQPHPELAPSAPSMKKNMLSYGTQTKSNHQHRTALPSHQQVHQPARPLRPSSKTASTTNHYLQHSSDPPPQTHATSSPTPARARLNKHTAHMINCDIADHILTDAQMPLPTTCVPNCRHFCGAHSPHQTATLRCERI
jgi:hypothetical protein